MATAEELIKPTTQDGDVGIFRDEQKRRLWQIIGATKFANRLATSLSAQAIHGAEIIRDDKLCEAEGYDNFRDFLDHHPESPMTYHQFDQRKKLLESEGDLLFDLLSSLDVPMKARTLLAGQIEVDGNELRVGDARVRRDDEAGILNLITIQYAKIQEQQRTIKRGEKDVEKHKRLAIEAEERAVVANPTGTVTGQALLTASGALSQLREALTEASDDEKQAMREPVFELLRVNQLECSAALGLIDKSEAQQARAQGADESPDGDDDDSLSD